MSSSREEKIQAIKDGMPVFTFNIVVASTGVIGIDGKYDKLVYSLLTDGAKQLVDDLIEEMAAAARHSQSPALKKFEALVDRSKRGSDEVLDSTEIIDESND